MQRIMDNLAASLNRTSVITVITKYETQGTPPATATSAVAGSIPGLASGGIVTGPTIALIGEAGPEAVIPLDRGMRAGSGTTINLTVNAGMGTNGAEVGRQIVDALKQYERRNGPVPITVA
jgi:SLT domain-containing protein